MRRTIRKISPNHHLREARSASRWSQQDVAERLGATTNTVSRWELGIATPGPYFRAKLCALFGKPPHELGLPDASKPDTPREPHLPSAQSVQSPPLWHIPYTPNPLFTGREAVLHQLVSDLCTKARPVRAITGLPGVGKTSLVIALAHHPQVQQHFRDGVLWVGLGPTPQITELLSFWSRSLDISPTEAQTLTTIDSTVRWLHQRLRDRRMLLILDDVWNVSDAVTFQLGGPSCVHVLTTRSPLLAYTVAHEQVTQLLPLSQTASSHLLQLLAPLAALRYPIELQALIEPSGGLPLALTLLGRSVHVHSLHSSSRRLLHTLQQLRHDIHSRFQVAESLSVEDATPSFPVGTERSLRTSIDMSVQHLSPLARQALHALAMFAPTPQSFSEEAALAICNTSATTFDILVDSGMVERCQEDRYQVHQTILDYARLQQSDPVVEERFIAFVVPFVERHAQESHLLDQDLHLITTALERAFIRRRYTLLLRGILALQTFLEQRRLYALAHTLFQWGQEAALALSDREGLVRLWLFRGCMADLCGESLQAQHAYVEGLTLARDLQHQELLPQLLVGLGGALVDTEMIQQAEQYLLEGLRAIEEMEDHTPLSRVFQYLGELADNLGKNEQALSLYQRGLTIARQTQDWKTASALLQDVGVQADRRGDYAQAVVCYEEGLRYARELGDMQRQSALLMNLGMLAWHERRLDEAINFSQESLKLAREIGHQMRISSVLQNLGMLMRVSDQDTRAAEYLQESLAVAQAIGHRWLICETLGEVGLLTLKQGQTAQAKEHFVEMQRQAQEIQAPLLEGIALFGFAQVAEQEGLRREALQAAQRSTAIFIQLDNRVLLREVEAWGMRLPENAGTPNDEAGQPQ